MNNLTATSQRVDEYRAPNSGYPSDGQDDGFALNLDRYITEAKVLWLWLAGIIAIGALTGLVATLLATPQYRANARIEVSQLAANVTALDPLENQGQVSERQYLNTQYELLESRFMAAPKKSQPQQNSWSGCCSIS